MRTCLYVFFALTTLCKAATACTPSDIAVKQIDWHREEFGSANIVGEIVNNCADPTGVQVQAVFRNADGKVVITHEYWPASTRNIAAGASYAFSGRWRIPDDAKTMTFSIIDTQHW